MNDFVWKNYVWNLNFPVEIQVMKLIEITCIQILLASSEF